MVADSANPLAGVFTHRESTDNGEITRRSEFSESFRIRRIDLVVIVLLCFTQVYREQTCVLAAPRPCDLDSNRLIESCEPGAASPRNHLAQSRFSERNTVTAGVAGDRPELLVEDLDQQFSLFRQTVGVNEEVTARVVKLY